jgi:hypothetical protein
MAEIALGPPHVVSDEGKGAVTRIAAKIMAGQIIWIHTRISLGAGARIWKSIILPSVRQDT